MRMVLRNVLEDLEGSVGHDGSSSGGRPDRLVRVLQYGVRERREASGAGDA